MTVSRGVPWNKALHLTKRVGVPPSRPVLEGRLAGERECTGAGMITGATILSRDAGKTK